MPEQRSPIVIKKVKGHEDHGGHGTWKIAYADFVTAMMAFFIVMWILGADDEVLHNIEGYFADPSGFMQAHTGGSGALSAGISPIRVQTPPARMLTRAEQQRRFEETAERITESLARGGFTIEGAVEMRITRDGLRIELIERTNGETFFPLGSAQAKPQMRQVIALIAQEVDRLATPVVLEGHTDAVQFGSRGYSNWDLSVDRANSARRTMETHGLNDSWVVEVRGYADRQLRVSNDPYHPSNRRISILLPYADG